MGFRCADLVTMGVGGCNYHTAESVFCQFEGDSHLRCSKAGDEPGFSVAVFWGSQEAFGLNPASML